MNYRLASFKPATRRLFYLLCGLLCLYAASFLYRPSRPRAFSSSLTLPEDFRDVREIRFSIPTKAEPVEMGAMTLIKIGERFFLHTVNGDYPVRQELIDRFFSLLSAKRSFITVSAAARDYPYYAIEDGHASQITLIREDKTILADLLFGSADRIGTGRYVRTGRSLKVFLIDNGIEPFLTVAASFWTDLQIYKSVFYQTGIQGLEYRNDSLLRNAEHEQHFHELELFLAKLSCIDVYSASAFQTPQTDSIRLTLGDGTALTLSLTPLESGDYVIFDSRSVNTYLLSGYTRDQLMRHIQTLTQTAVE